MGGALPREVLPRQCTNKEKIIKKPYKLGISSPQNTVRIYCTNRTAKEKEIKTMAKCKICNREMLVANGCTVSVLFQSGKKYQRIRVGDPEDWKPVKKGKRCTDCNAKYGHFHHFNCSHETCPICKKQLLVCECENIYFEVQ